MSNLMTVTMVARQLCVSRKRVYNLIEEGRLDSLRTGLRNIRVPRESLERFVRDGIAIEKRQRGLDIAPMPTHRRAME